LITLEQQLRKQP